VDEHRDELVDLDRAIGDGDHGENMRRGFAAVLSKLDGPLETPGAVLKLVASTLISTVGGAAGPLYGTAFLRAAAATGKGGELSAQCVVDALDAALGGVVARGKAEVGDKTMVDALVPFAETLGREVDGGTDLATAWANAAAAASAAAAATAELLPRMGRARPHAEKSLGTPDPGAHSFALIVSAVAEAIAGDVGAPKEEEAQHA
jgi:phosphoenolpyruvate---glycerone phosphotransferase subunit DhaL